jgi:FADH2 O2-dependent halogenase
VECHELTRVTHVGARDDATLSIRCDGHPAVTCGDVVDASGSAAVTRNFFANADWTDRLRTRTCTAFAHFRDVASYSQLENQRHGDRRASLPFDADDAAQHHLVDDGWLWMLRMNNGVTSVGMTSPIPGDAAEVEVARRRTNCVDVLASKCQRYPRLAAVLNAACVVDPPGGIVSLPRVQRWLDPVARPHCFLLPTTAFTLDPLHSTGIAHALAGVDRLVDLLLAGGDERRVREYRDGLIAEADHLDRLIALAYDAMPRFDRFVAACMLYFAAAIGCEERIAAGAVPGRLWLADDDGFVKLVRDCRDQFAAVQDDRLLIDGLRRRLAPWNTAGLLDESLHNRYAYTATK